MKRQRGVSLTEMLVCLVIIAILVGLLSPVFSKTKASAKQVGDVSNMRQIYAALQLYKADNEEYPLRTSTRQSLRTYLGGYWLTCNSGQNANSEYHILGIPDFARRVRPGLYESLEECRRRRGPSFPLIQDQNHMSDVIKFRNGFAFLLVVRESGGVEQVRVDDLRKRVNSENYNLWPCQIEKNGFLDLNY